MKRVLFVCVENSCRSQMAEGFARSLGVGLLDAQSAGSRPSGTVNETAIALMGEAGVDLSRNRSKGIADLPSGAWDYVFTMGCGDACPLVPAVRGDDWAIPDPKHLPPDEFRKVRDLIAAKVAALVEEIRSAEDRSAR